MEVSAIKAYDLINEVKAYTQSSSVPEAIVIALKERIDICNIKELNKKIAQKPIFINNGQKIREMNRAI